ncbi:hypothetical protein Lfu02_32200 [Longispora fulva]|uniref:Uncharacterized protein n=1 Tax=Longispora fulva TaxID=619741 RepID=A0A8J7GWV9_9ACTN|nr:hypothetical protein [Longispora fulva]MBG6139351.1 hypothetical protein [Longispora fulva]GIG58848.1 hypothetical protein Lfu02_32200 [Longispora fulva]
MNEEQAAERIECYIEEAVRQVSPRPTMRRALFTSVPCDGLVRAAPGEVGVSVEHNHALVEVPRAGHAAVLDTLFGYWAGLDYTVLRDHRSAGAPGVVVETPDGFVLKVDAGYSGDGLYLSGSSPCVNVV